MFFSSAEANTSAVPGLSSICCDRIVELSKLKFTLVPGCASSNCWPSAVNAVLSDAAPNTLRVCFDAVVVPEEPLSFALLPHAVSAIASRSASTAAPNVFWPVRIRMAPGDLVGE